MYNPFPWYDEITLLACGALVRAERNDQTCGLQLDDKGAHIQGHCLVTNVHGGGTTVLLSRNSPTALVEAWCPGTMSRHLLM